MSSYAAEQEQVFRNCEQEYYRIMDSNLPQEEKNRLLADVTERASHSRELQENYGNMAKQAQELSNYYGQNLEAGKRTTYVGVGGGDQMESLRPLIQRQGLEVPDFHGTCGDCSCANAMTLLGDPKTEGAVVARAREIGECHDEPIDTPAIRAMERLPFGGAQKAEAMRAEIRAKNGGTSVVNREKILDSFGYDCSSMNNQTLDDVANHIRNGEAVVYNLDCHVLKEGQPGSDLSMSLRSTNHAVTLTGVETDAQGNAIGAWLRDTGNWSQQGADIYVNAEDFRKLGLTRGCSVQYIKRRG